MTKVRAGLIRWTLTAAIVAGASSALANGAGSAAPHVGHRETPPSAREARMLRAVRPRAQAAARYARQAEATARQVHAAMARGDRDFVRRFRPVVREFHLAASVEHDTVWQRLAAAVPAGDGVAAAPPSTRYAAALAQHRLAAERHKVVRDNKAWATDAPYDVRTTHDAQASSAAAKRQSDQVAALTELDAGAADAKTPPRTAGKP